MKAFRLSAFATALGFVVVLLGLPGITQARSGPMSGRDSVGQSLALPAYSEANHQIGKIVMTVTNHGTFGTGYQKSGTDFLTGELLQSCEFPKGSRTQYLFVGTFWIGAVAGRDTLVSAGADGWNAGEELHPDAPPLGKMIYRSTIDPTKSTFEDAISEEDFVAVYFDTCITGCLGVRPDPVAQRPHRPLNIQITERSFAWSYTYADNFILFDYAVKNIGRNRLKRVYMGIYVDADVMAQNNQNGFLDDVCGFRHSLPAFYSTTRCSWEDTINIAWIADNEGDPTWPPPVPNVTGTRIVRTPSDSLDISFNWWVSNGDSRLDWGPRHKTDTRDLTTGGNGTPVGDNNKYWYLRNGEFDYDQVFTAGISPLDTLWQYPPEGLARDIADGFDTRYLLSFGPFEIDPGQTLPISFAYVGGENFHPNKNNASNLPDHPNEYYGNLDFSNLGYGAIWSSWIYDNPGFDTDSDGYMGKHHICNAGSDTSYERIDTIYDTITIDPPVITIRYDTIWRFADTVWYEGDGVPDFRGASPPPGPSSWAAVYNGVRTPALRVYPSVGKVMVRFNGLKSETSRDVFSRTLDFEGYRVYYARDERRSSYTLYTSYDKRDFNKWVWTMQGITGSWTLRDIPFTLEQLRCLYAPGGCADSGWSPLQYPRENPYRLPSNPDSIFYFAPQDFNNFEFGVSSLIRKVYPNEPYPPKLDPDSVDVSYLTPEGFFKYFEYEIELDNLLLSVPYYISVTAFDFGSPKTGLGALESSPTLNPAVTYPLWSSQTVVDSNLKAFVWPNPYRIDGNYRDEGYEGRTDINLPPDRVRRVHFANLPPQCTIRIFTLDGDLVREIRHDLPVSDPMSNNASWDLITRNTQMAVSGLYYWTIEKPDGSVQIGKLVLIM
ncbi:MAG: hypothetical protein HY851_00085 [candidate division Zixibacteria bacterium]|nr:hypothetical protein [candidate division Zixibacteria bacterium]